jgi:hypothetical protein
LCGLFKEAPREQRVFIFADYEQIPYCAIESPSQFPPLYELSNALPESVVPVSATGGDSSSGQSGDSSSGSSSDVKVLPPGTEVEFLYTSRSGDFARQVMESFVRQPAVAEVLGNPDWASAFTVQPSAQMHAQVLTFDASGGACVWVDLCCNKHQKLRPCLRQ